MIPLDEGESVPVGEIFDLGFPRRSFQNPVARMLFPDGCIPSCCIQNITFWNDESVSIRLHPNFALPGLPTELKFTGDDAKEARRQIRRQCGQWTDLMDKQKWINNKRAVGRRHIARLLKKG
jgi:hypothetical protein